MSTYTLTGSGVQALSALVGALHVHINALPPGSGTGNANPVNRYHVGFIRPGDATAFWSPFPIEADDAWIGLPVGTTRIGYALEPSGSIDVTEVFGASPFTGPAGPAGSPGSSGSTLIATSTLAATAASVSFAAIPNTYRDLLIEGYSWTNSGHAVGTDSLLLRLNADAGANYDWTGHFDFWNSSGNIAQVNAGSSLSLAPGQMGGGASPYAFTRFRCLIQEYANSSWPKAFEALCLRMDGAGSNYVRIFTWGAWRTANAPITQVTLLPSAGSFAIGSVFSVYGVG